MATEWCGDLKLEIQGLGVMHWLRRHGPTNLSGEAWIPLGHLVLASAAYGAGPESRVVFRVKADAPAAHTPDVLRFAVEAIAELPDADLLEDASIRVEALAYGANRLPRRFARA